MRRLSALNCSASLSLHFQNSVVCNKILNHITQICLSLDSNSQAHSSCRSIILFLFFQAFCCQIFGQFKPFQFQFFSPFAACSKNQPISERLPCKPLEHLSLVMIHNMNFTIKKATPCFRTTPSDSERLVLSVQQTQKQRFSITPPFLF